MPDAVRYARAHVSTMPDWELAASVEHWDRVLAKARIHCPSDVEIIEDWKREITDEQAKRERLAYVRARNPFDLQPVIDAIKTRGDILAVAGVRLQHGLTYQSAWNLSASRHVVHFVCPFHPDRSPSLAVYPRKNDWHCFGCAEHGDLIALVMKLDGLTFMQAVQALAAEFGIELPEAKKPRLTIE